MKIENRFAHIIRIVTVPPVMAAWLMLSLWFGDRALFPCGFRAVAAALVCLTLLPALAYPLSRAIPRLREKGREGQRNLAFVLSALGYVGGRNTSA